MHRRARLGLGYLPQEASVFRKLSVADNVMAILETRRDLDADGRRRRLEELLEELKVAHIRDSLGQSLSGGERRRVEIARALAMEPRFVLLDEPFAGVDPLAVADIQASIEHLRQRGMQVGVVSRGYGRSGDQCLEVLPTTPGADSGDEPALDPGSTEQKINALGKNLYIPEWLPLSKLPDTPPTVTRA